MTDRGETPILGYADDTNVKAPGLGLRTYSVHGKGLSAAEMGVFLGLKGEARSS